ncbi:MAG: hypothetical protein FWE06_09220 [Oscillospiraceae bacterium]|nr:hypothetical protein [Oscillospiraceae bacterium]
MPKEKPLLMQYTHIKAQNPETILMFRIGGFYVMVEKDAYAANKVLGTQVISRTIGAGNVPACGVPPSVVKESAQTLAESGYTVAICDQADGASEFGDVKHREVTAIIRPNENVSPAVPVSDEEYEAFVIQFENEQSEKAAQKVKQSVQPDVSSILSELKSLDLDEISPQKAWALLYHWQKTYCKLKD